MAKCVSAGLWNPNDPRPSQPGVMDKTGFETGTSLASEDFLRVRETEKHFTQMIF